MEAIFGTPLPLILGVIAGLLVGSVWSLHYERVGRAQDQAAMVGGRIVATGTRATGAMLANASELPVFGVVAWVVATAGSEPATGEEWVAMIRQGEAPDGPTRAPNRPTESRDASTPALLPLLAPGSTDLPLPAWARSGAGGGPAVELGFTDASGRHWIRRATGRLERIDVPAWRHYGFASPDTI